jgi:hypothetical protein
MDLCFCLISHPSALLSSSELATMPLQSPLGLWQAYLLSQQLSLCINLKHVFGSNTTCQIIQSWWSMPVPISLDCYLYCGINGPTDIIKIYILSWFCVKRGKSNYMNYILLFYLTIHWIIIVGRHINLPMRGYKIVSRMLFMLKRNEHGKSVGIKVSACINLLHVFGSNTVTLSSTAE